MADVSFFSVLGLPAVTPPMEPQETTNHDPAVSAEATVKRCWTEPMLVLFFILGLCSVTIQATLVREFMVAFHGNELCLGLFFALWLFWIAFGAALGGAISRIVRRFVRPLFIAAIVIGMATPLAQIYAIRLVRVLLRVDPGLLVPFGSMALFTLICLAPFSFVIGFTFPLGYALHAKGERDASAIARLYIAESLGFLVGGVFFTFVLVMRYGAFLNVGLAFCVALAGCVGFGLRRSRTVSGVFTGLGLVLGVTVFALGLPSLAGLDRTSVEGRWTALRSGLRLLKGVDSKYENLVIGERDEQYSVFGSGSYMFCFPNEYDLGSVAHYVLCEHPNPKKVLLIGNGSHGLIGQMLAGPVQQIQHVELDPAVTELCRPYLPESDRALLSDPRVRTTYADGRFFVKRTKEKYDVVFLNVPDPTTAMMNRYYTREFFREAKRILAPGGVLALSMSSSANYVGELVGDYIGSIFHTLRLEFPHIVVSPGGMNYLFASQSPGVVTNDKALLAKRFLERKIETDYFTEYHFDMLFQEGRAEFIWNELMARKDARINTDFRPVSYFYSLLLWDRFSGSHLQKIMPRFKNLRFHHAGWALLVLILIRLGYLCFRHWKHAPQARFNSLLAVGVCGFSSMGFNIVLIFAFQNLYGYLYHMIGLIVALFMFGLAGGATTMNAAMNRIRRKDLGLLAVEALLLGYAVALPWCIKLLSASSLSSAPLWISQVVFLALIAAAGWVSGLCFPIVSAIYVGESRSSVTAAGKVDGADHFGACVGAALSGTVLLPIVGVVESCYLFAAMNAACAVLLLVQIISTSKERAA